MKTKTIMGIFFTLLFILVAIGFVGSFVRTEREFDAHLQELDRRIAYYERSAR